MYQFFLKGRDPISSLTHFIGACLSLLATIILVFQSVTLQETSLLMIVSVSVFGLSLIALYSASSYYHFLKGTPEQELFFRKVDHAMIYVLIAGSYTPICLNFMEKKEGIIFVTAIWIVAFIGIIIKIFWMDAPRWLSTSIYLLMGWAIVFDINAFNSIPKDCLRLLIMEGVSYSIGAIIYIIKKPNISPEFGFHEIFHIFIMIGSLFHFLAVLFYVL